MSSPVLPSPRLARLTIELGTFSSGKFPDDLTGSVAFTHGGAVLTQNLSPRQCHELRCLVQPYFGEYVARLAAALGDGK